MLYAVGIPTGFLLYHQTMSQTICTPTSAAINGRSLSRETAARRRISIYLSEPISVGNILVGLPDGTREIADAKAAHEKRVTSELAKLNPKLP